MFNKPARVYLFQTYSNLISAACTRSIHYVRTTHDPGYVVWFIRPVIIRVKGNYPCATTAAIFDPQNPCNCGGVFTLSIRHRSIVTSSSMDYTKGTMSSKTFLTLETNCNVLQKYF